MKRLSTRLLTVFATFGLLATVLPVGVAAVDITDPGWIPWVGVPAADTGAWVRAFGAAGSTMWAGTEGDGVFCSTNAGVTWQNCGSGLPSATSVRQIKAGLTSTTIATDYGIFKSTGSGLSWGAWQPVGQGAGSNKLNAAVQTLLDVPTKGTLAGVVGGLYRSMDGGSTWADSSAGIPDGATVWYLDSYTWLPNYILAATSAGAYSSTDGGASWTPVTLGLPTNSNILRIVSDPQTPLTWYAITSSAGVFRSETAGLLWEPVNTGLPAGGLQVRSIALLPVAAAYSDILIGTSVGVFSSIDKGDSWKAISNDGLNGHTSVWAVTTTTSSVPLHPAIVAGAQGGGVAYRIMSPPTNTALPAITTLPPVVGVTLTTSNGSWNGTDTKTYSYQWYSCTTTSTSSCTKISGATQKTYTPVPADQGKRLQARVSVSNPVSIPSALATASSAITGLVAANPATLPGASIRNNPTITEQHPGTTTPGDVLTANHNTWSPAATTYKYEWFRCTTSNTGCVSVVAPTTTATYTVKIADVGSHMGVRVYGSNASGSAISDLGYEASEVLPDQVTTVSPPVVTGLPWVGQKLNAAIGSYSGPVANTWITWQYCSTSSTSSCGSLAGSTNSAVSPLLNSTQLGGYLRVKVEVDVNGFGQYPATLVVYSGLAGPIVNAPPHVSNSVLPRVFGIPAPGVLLYVSKGTWAGSPTYRYRWLRCNAAGTSCVGVGALVNTYTVLAGDVGYTFRALVTGSNGWPGSVTVQTTATPVTVSTLAPTYIGGASISGTVAVGSTLTVAKGSWSASPAATFTYQWLRDGVAIAGQTATTHVIVTADKGHKLAVKITAKNTLGTASMTTAATVTVP